MLNCCFFLLFDSNLIVHEQKHLLQYKCSTLHPTHPQTHNNNKNPKKQKTTKKKTTTKSAHTILFSKPSLHQTNNLFIFSSCLRYLEKKTSLAYPIQAKWLSFIHVSKHLGTLYQKAHLSVHIIFQHRMMALVNHCLDTHLNTGNPWDFKKNSNVHFKYG